MNKIYIILLLLIAVLPATAQKITFPENITYSANINQKENHLHINLDINLDNVHIPRQEMVVLTPVLVTENNIEYHLAPAVIAGTTRYKAINRLLGYGNQVFGQVPRALVKRKNGSAQKATLTYVIPYEDWMRGADMYLYGDASGCVNCGNTEKKYLVQNNIVEPLPPLFTPQYQVSYIVPEAEVKMRSENFVARINYQVNRFELLPNYGNNATVLKEVDDLIRELQNDPDLTITQHKVTGYASPEGNFNSNLTLSANRAKSFMDYLQQKYKWDTNRISHSGKGEDWAGLREALANATGISHHDEVISIIDNTPDIAKRKQALKSLAGGSVYAALLKEIYPLLRRNEFEVSYIARDFNVNEARQVIRTRPQLLSLNEMFLVANSYPKDSKEFKEVFEIAARMFPENPIGKVNTAAMEIETGSVGRAIEHLKGIENPESWNNLGVAYAQQKNFTLARQYLKRAVQAGNTNAAHNLDQLEKKEENDKYYK